MSWWKGVRELFTVGLDVRVEALKQADEATQSTGDEIQQLREFLPSVLTNPEQAKMMFSLQQALYLGRIHEAFRGMRDSEDRADALYWSGQWIVASMDCCVNEYANPS